MYYLSKLNYFLSKEIKQLICATCANFGQQRSLMCLKKNEITDTVIDTWEMQLHMLNAPLN